MAVPAARHPQQWILRHGELVAVAGDRSHHEGVVVECRILRDFDLGVEEDDGGGLAHHGVLVDSVDGAQHDAERTVPVGHLQHCALRAPDGQARRGEGHAGQQRGGATVDLDHETVSDPTGSEDGGDVGVERRHHRLQVIQVGRRDAQSVEEASPGSICHGVDSSGS
jgi:hypothetical protein